MHSQEYQALYTNLKPGDTLITITRFGTTQLVFDTGGRLLHPVPQAMADALELVMERERTDNPLEAVRLMWGRYNTPLWYTGPGSLADVYLQGEAGFDNLACSAADLGGDAEDIMERYATAVVPDPVADTRSNLIWAAIACDYRDSHQPLGCRPGRRQLLVGGQHERLRFPDRRPRRGTPDARVCARCLRSR